MCNLPEGRIRPKMGLLVWKICCIDNTHVGLVFKFLPHSHRQACKRVFAQAPHTESPQGTVTLQGVLWGSLSRPNKPEELRRQPCEGAEADSDEDDLDILCSDEVRHSTALSTSPGLSFAGPNSLASLQLMGGDSQEQGMASWQCSSPVLEDADMEDDSETDTLHPVQFTPFTLDGEGDTAGVPSYAESRSEGTSKPRRPLLVDAKGMQQLFGPQKGGPQGQASSAGTHHQHQRFGGYRQGSQGRRVGGASPGRGPRPPPRKKFSPVPSPPSCTPVEEQPNKDAVLDMLASTWIRAGGLDDIQACEQALDREYSTAPPDPVNAEHVDQLLELFPQLTRDMAALMIRVRPASVSAFSVVCVESSLGLVSLCTWVHAGMGVSACRSLCKGCCFKVFW